LPVRFLGSLFSGFLRSFDCGLMRHSGGLVVSRIDNRLDDLVVGVAMPRLPSRGPVPRRRGR
jgi:hypothetical protein